MVGWNDEGALRVRVKAPPVDGAANAALIQLLAKRLGVAKSAITLITGATARNKIIEVEETLYAPPLYSTRESF